MITIEEVNMNYRQIIFHSFSFLIILTIFVLFIPQPEHPDGLLHYHNYYSDISDNKFYFDRFYSYIFSFFDKFYVSIGFESFCLKKNIVEAEYCFGAHSYSNAFQNNLYKFGLNIPIMDYNYIYPIFSHQLSLITINSFIFFLFLFSAKFFNSKETTLFLIIIFFYAPSVLSVFSYLSPNIISIIFHFLIFINIINSKYIISFSLIILSIILDRQNVILAFVMLNFFMIKLFYKNYKNIIKRLGIIILYLIIITSFLLFLSYNVAGSDMIYLNLSEFNPIKSLITMYLSLYYIGGSMSVLSFELEYLFFFLILIFFIYKNSKISPHNKGIHLFIFIAINLTFFQILFVFKSIDQGRYYYILLLNIIYFFILEYKVFLRDNFFLIICLLYSLNIVKIIKHFNILY